MTMFGFGSGGGDPNLSSKIAELKKRKSAPDKVTDFLEHDLGVDPRDLAYRLDQAKERLSAFMLVHGVRTAKVIGNSLGLQRIEFHTDPDTLADCPNCNVHGDGYWDDHVGGDWHCYNCDETHPVPVKAEEIAAAVTSDSGVDDWHDAKRIYVAFLADFHQDLDPLEDHAQIRCFTAERQWNGTVELGGWAIDTPEPDISTYPTGANLRIQRTILNEEGGARPERDYVRVGGLFNDTDIVNLTTMQPIEDLSGFIVIEVL